MVKKTIVSGKKTSYYDQWETLYILHNVSKIPKHINLRLSYLKHFLIWSNSGLGFGMVVASVTFAFYSAIISNWILYYIANSFFNPLPWSTCGNSWNSKYCVDERYSTYSNMTTNTSVDSRMKPNLTIMASDNLTGMNTHFVTSEEEFWEYVYFEVWIIANCWLK